MDQLLITRATPDVAYVIVHDTGNYFAVDSVCTDAAGTSATPVGGSVGDQMSGNLSMKPVQCQSGPHPVNCASGDFWHTFTDLSVPGRGVPLDLTRTYNSALTSTASTFGYGWSSSYDMSLAVNGGTGDVTVTQEDGTTDTFEPNGSGGYTTLPSIFATLVQNGNGTYTFTRHSTQIFTFSSSGQLVSESDLRRLCDVPRLQRLQPAHQCHGPGGSLPFFFLWGQRSCLGGDRAGWPVRLLLLRRLG